MLNQGFLKLCSDHGGLRAANNIMFLLRSQNHLTQIVCFYPCRNHRFWREIQKPTYQERRTTTAASLLFYSSFAARLIGLMFTVKLFYFTLDNGIVATLIATSSSFVGGSNRTWSCRPQQCGVDAGCAPATDAEPSRQHHQCL
jgi:hypothetical protein